MEPFQIGVRSLLYGSGAAADAPLEQELAFGLAQPAPDAVRLTDSKSVGTALGDHGAAAAHLLGAELTLSPSPSAFTIGVEEHRRIDTTAKSLHLPIPDIRIGSGKLLRLRHMENPSLLAHFAKLGGYESVEPN
ncbi:hypothetical protein BN975_01826 [Mycolicibacterium farcinogenes]|uniref:Uncharacterized protein n=1 Tax=Mycolicibacterium senegalense TaxID=1796 RepID=A0A378W5F3_9MYCO|nr:hypothetical protein BN975_01826 [Mycolicibacterium farcinogenes]SUA27478.1 Uncharacterised protein [Mycolicibacterium senegalense]